MLTFTLIFSSVVSAAPGDIIHTGTKKLYSPEDIEILIEDISAGADTSLFYEELEGGRYVNIESRELAHLEYLRTLAISNNIDSQVDLDIFLQNNRSEIQTMLDNISESLVVSDFDSIPDGGKGSKEDYYGIDYAPKLQSPAHYSMPILGSADGTSRFESLVFPTGSSRYFYKILDTPDNDLVFNQVIEDGIEYSPGEDIRVDAEKYIALYATDRSNRLKAYANILVEEDMIRRAAEKLEGGTITMATEIAYGVKLTGLSLDGDWRYFVRGNKLENVFTDNIFDTISYGEGMEITVADGSLTIGDGFKRYVYLVKYHEGKIEKYYEFEVSKGQISMPPELLASDDYSGPLMGIESGTTRFSQLNMDGATWRVAVGSGLNIPVAGGSFGGNGYSAGDNIEAEVGDQLLLIAMIDNKVSHYAFFELEEGHVRGLPPPAIDGLTAKKGNQPGTTMVEDLELPTGATKWMYALGDDLSEAFLDRAFVGAEHYGLGQDIEAKNGDKLHILAVDDQGKVKAYGSVTLGPSEVKDPLAKEMEETFHYSMPEKGDSVGAIKFRHLSYGGAELHYRLSEKSKDVPEMDSDLPSESVKIDNIDDIQIFGENEPLLKDERGFTRYLMVYALDNNGVIAYKEFIINQNDVRLPDADKLPWKNYKDTEDGEALEGGTVQNSTILKVLNKDGIPNANGLKYVYRFIGENNAPNINEIPKDTKNLNPGANLTPAMVGQYLQILLVDGGNRTKYYANIKLSEDNIRIGDASLLRHIYNYTNPEPGTEFESIRFSSLSFDGVEGATKFMVALPDEVYRAVEFNGTVPGAFDYATIDENDTIAYEDIDGKSDSNGNILGVDVSINRQVLLLATDDEDKVKAYQAFALNANMVRGKAAVELKANNYTIGKGDKPGTVKFTSLSPFGVNNNTWMYMWSVEDVFSDNLPFEGQIASEAIRLNTRNLDPYTLEGLDNIVAGDDPAFGYILLLATNGNRILGYKIIKLTKDEVQSAADTLEVELTKGCTTDGTEITGDEADLVHKYLISPSPFGEKPAPNSAVPSNALNMPESKEIQVRVGEWLRLFSIDGNKVVKYADIEIKDQDVKRGSASLEILNPDDDKPLEILEGRIRASAVRMKVSLTDAKWADVVNDPSIKGALLDGLKAVGNETGQWNNVIEQMKNSRYSIIKSDETTITITTSATMGYDITEDQIITLTIPPSALIGAINPIVADEKIVVKPTIDARIYGNIVNDIRQSEINSGNATIIVEIVDSRWADDIEGKKGDILNGFVSDGLKWEELKGKIYDDRDINLIDPQRVSIAIPANTVEIDEPETITLTIDKDLVVDARNNIVATPLFTIYPDILPIPVEVVEDTVLLEAPGYVNALEGQDTWTIKLDGLTFKSDFSVAKDIVTSNIAAGLKLEVDKAGNDGLTIRLIGKSTRELNDGAINLVIRASAIDQKNYSDSEVIRLEYIKNEKVNLDNISYEIKDDPDKGIYLKIGDTSIDFSMLEYSTDSTDGIKGSWQTILDEKISNVLEPITIYVREKSQRGNFKLLVKLVNPPAPEGIYIEEYQYGDELKVKLNQDKDLEYNLEYNLGDFDVWTDVNDEIELNGDSVLKVRKKAVVGHNGDLASLATGKLNGVYLGGVAMDVGQGKISGVNANMEYSTNGGDTFIAVAARATEVSGVNFVEDMNVVLREKGNIINSRDLGTIGRETFVEDDLSHVDFSIVDREIGSTVVDLEKLQYRIDNEPWKDVGNGKNIEFKPGSLEFRVKGSPANLASYPREKTVISSYASPPEVRVDDLNKKIEYREDSEWKDITDTPMVLEYNIDSQSAWKDGNTWDPQDVKGENAKVQIRIKATKDKLHSQSITINFTRNLTFGDVKLNVAQGYIEGTTVEMQYSTNSTDGKNGTWIDAARDRTPVNFIEGMTVYIREKAKFGNFSKLATVERMEKPSLDDVTYDIAARTISNNQGQDLQYRIKVTGNEAWQDMGTETTVYEVDFKPGILQFRSMGSSEKLPSFGEDKVTIPARASAPELKYDDVKYKISNLSILNENNEPIYEYSINGGPWVDGNVDMEFEGGDIVRLRLKAEQDKLASDEQEIKFTPNLNLYDVRLNVSGGRIENTTADMEYSIDSTNGEDGLWLSCTASNTTIPLKAGMTVYVREKAKPRNSRLVNEDAIGQNQFSDYNDGDNFIENKIDYNVLKKTISIKLAELDCQDLVNNLQYRIGSGNWINIDYVELKTGEDNTLAFNVNFVTGNLEFRLRGDENTLPSDVAVGGVIKTPASAPKVSKGFDKDEYRNKVEYIGDLEGLEYRFGENGPWIDGKYLENEELDRDVYIRVKAEEKELASAVKVLDFKSVLNLKVVNLSTHVHPFVLNGTTDQMEYRIIRKDENGDALPPHSWKDADDGNTVLADWLKEDNLLKIEIRDINQHENSIEIK